MNSYYELIMQNQIDINDQCHDQGQSGKSINIQPQQTFYWYQYIHIVFLFCFIYLIISFFSLLSLQLNKKLYFFICLLVFLSWLHFCIGLFASFSISLPTSFLYFTCYHSLCYSYSQRIPTDKVKKIQEAKSEKMKERQMSISINWLNILRYL